MRYLIGMAVAAFVSFSSAEGQQAPADTAGAESAVAAEENRQAVPAEPGSSARELRDALELLAETFEAAAVRAANDPELRRAALRAAAGSIEVAQLVLVDNSARMEEALARAADRLAELSAELRARQQP